MIEFQGHGTIQLVANVALASNVLLLVAALFWAHKAGIKVLIVLVWALYLLMAPNALYAALEVKHLLLWDKIADTPSIASFLVFGGIALFGTVCTLAAVLGPVYIVSALRKRPLLTCFALSLHQAVGASLGLLDTSVGDPLVNQQNFRHALILLSKSENRIAFCLLLMLGIFALSVVVLHLLRHKIVTQYVNVEP